MDVMEIRRGALGVEGPRKTAGTSEKGASFVAMVGEAQSRLQQEAESPWQELARRKEEISEKLRRGETEETFQIGGGSYTLKEWERMMERFDSLEEWIRYMTEERWKGQRQRAFQQALGEPREGADPV